MSCYVKLFVDNMRYKKETINEINESFDNREITSDEKKIILHN